MERLLKRGQLLAFGETLHGDDASSRRLPHRNQARADLLVVQQNRAGAAVAGIAADLRTRQTQLVPQDIGKAFDRTRGDSHVPDR